MHFASLATFRNSFNTIDFPLYNKYECFLSLLICVLCMFCGVTKHIFFYFILFYFTFIFYFTFSCFSALTLLVWHQEEHPACTNWVMRCWCGYLSGARCRLLAAYGPADATAVTKPNHLLSHLNPDWFYRSGTGLPRLFWKEAVKL